MLAIVAAAYWLLASGCRLLVAAYWLLGHKWDPSSSNLGIVGTWKQAFMGRLCAGMGAVLTGGGSGAGGGGGCRREGVLGAGVVIGACIQNN